MHDGISFEQLGKPALVICTHPFELTGRNIARTLGVSDYPFAMVDHPIGSRTPPEIRVRAADAFAQGQRILTGGAFSPGEREGLPLARGAFSGSEGPPLARGTP